MIALHAKPAKMLRPITFVMVKIVPLTSSNSRTHQQKKNSVGKHYLYVRWKLYEMTANLKRATHS